MLFTENLNGDVNAELRKALSTSTTALIPEVVTAGIQKYVEDSSPIFNMVPKKDWPTNTYTLRSLTDLPTATWGTDGGALPAATVGTYAKPTQAMKYIYTRGEVTGPMQAASGGLLDALKYEIEIHADALVRNIELKLISGNSGSDVKEIDGLSTQITFAKAAASATMTLALVDEALDLPSRYPTDIICSRAKGRRFNALLQAQQRFVDRTEIAGGFKVMTYNGLPILCVDNDADTDLDTVVLFPDKRQILMPINKQLFYEPLAKVKDSYDFFIGMYCCLAVEGVTRYHSKLTGLATG